MLQGVALCCDLFLIILSVVCSSVLQYVAVRCSVFQRVYFVSSHQCCVAVCCSVLQCVAVCCSVWQCALFSVILLLEVLVQCVEVSGSVLW